MNRQPAITGTSPLTVGETATALGLSPHTVRAWITQRRLGHVRLGRSIRVPSSEVSRLLHDNFRPAKATLGRGGQGRD
jgi:excisionase family DNA binding protein